MSAAAPATSRPSRGRILAARAFLVLGVVLTLISILSTYVKREALDEQRFRETSQELIANPEIQQQVSATLVDYLYANVDVSQELTGKLPENLQGLAAPIAGLARELVDRGAQELLTRPRVQSTFVDVSSAAQLQLVKVLHGDTKVVETTDGNVVLDLRPLVLKLGDRFGFVANLADKIPQGSAQITILQSQDLKTAQDVTHWLEQVANVVWVFALACWVAAIWLARGRRREEVRSLGIGLFAVGVLVLAVRWLAGTYIVDSVVTSDTVRPAARAAWDIITNALAAAGWVVLIGGILVAAGAWLAGPGERPADLRAYLAPLMRRGGVAWGAFVLVMSLLIWALPIQVFRTTAILVVMGAIGFEVLRRQVLREAAADAESLHEPAVPSEPPSAGV